MANKKFINIIEKEPLAVLKDAVKVEKTTKKYWNVLGPGLTTGAADDDPSGIATYSQAGARHGFGLLWLSVITFPLMSVVQEMCARIGIVTGRGLAGNIKKHFSRRVLYTCTLLLFCANALNIGADLGAMAAAVRLLSPSFNFYFAVIAFSIFSILLQTFLPYARYAKYLKWLALVLLTYVASALLAHLDWGALGRSLIHPSISFKGDQILLIAAILGTTISPYLFFWQTSQEIENEIMAGAKSLAARMGTNKKAIKEMRTDVWSGMFLSNVVMFFIIAACGAVLFPQGITDIQSANQAAEALRPFAGDATYWLFSIGIIGTGLLAIPVLAGSSSYAVAESFNWKEGFNRKFGQAHAFYGVLFISVLVGLAINFLGIDPIDALIFSAVANAIVAPVVLALIVILGSNKAIMGKWVNKPSTTFFGWIVTAIMVAASLAAIISIIGGN